MADQQHPIDVGELVDDLRRRVDEARARGEYGDDVGEGPLDPVAAPRRVRFRPEVGYSTKRLVGKPITGVKQSLFKLQRQALDDLAAQTDAGLSRNEAHARQLHAIAERRAEEAERQLAEVRERLGALETELDRLEVAPRLARLERARKSAPTAPSAPAAAQPAAAPAVAPATKALDYLLFEARFRGAEETIRERLEVYREALSPRSRVVDLGCGRGELLMMLREAGVPCYGIDTESDFVEQCVERGLEVTEGDAIAHLEGLDRGAVDAVVSTHVVEHLSPGDLGRLIQGAADVLPAGGVLIMETPNPESLVAGSINFHRDPTHLRPIHPDTLAFACESAGFASAEILRLSPFGETERLPELPPENPAAEDFNPVIERLNAVLFGFQDYAVVATAGP